jgi:hypothetical protein
MIDDTKDILEWYKKRIEFLLNCDTIPNTLSPDDKTTPIHKKYIIIDKIDRNLLPHQTISIHEFYDIPTPIDKIDKNKIIKGLHLCVSIQIDGLRDIYMTDFNELRFIFPSEANNYNSLYLDLMEHPDDKNYILIQPMLFNT